MYEKIDKVNIELTDKCNSRCPQCHRTDVHGLGKADWLPLVQWSLDDFKKAFSITTMYHIAEFELCGTWGDPMMNKDIFEICQYIIKYSFSKIKINTNGSIRNSEWWWNFGTLCGDRLTVVFDIEGVTQEQHTHYRQILIWKKY